MDPETREALAGLERRLVESAAATHRLIADSESRTHAHVDGRLGESEDRMRSHLEGRLAESEGRMRSHLEGRLAESEGRMRSYIDLRLTESEERTRRHFGVVAESLHGDIRTLAEGVTAFAEASMRRDTELGARIDGLEPRVLGLETRVSVLEQSRPRRRRRR